MGKKLPELCVERVLLTGRCAGGECFFIRRAGEVGGRCAEGGGDDLEEKLARQCELNAQLDLENAKAVDAE